MLNFTTIRKPLEDLLVCKKSGKINLTLSKVYNCTFCESSREQFLQARSIIDIWPCLKYVSLSFFITLGLWKKVFTVLVIQLPQ